MRNSEAQRYARWSLAAAGLLALAVTGVYLRNVFIARQAEKKAPPAVPPTVEQRSNEFSFSKVEGQRTIYTVHASRATEFKEGNRDLLEDVDIVVNGKKGDRNDTLRTRACDFISNTGKITCAGEVQIRLERAGASPAGAGAIQVTTSAVAFDRDSGEAHTDKPLTFHWPAGDGRAVGLSYVSGAGTLQLRQNVELNLHPSSNATVDKSEIPKAKILHISGDSMSFQRDERLVSMEGNVHAQQAAHELTAKVVSVELDDSFQAKRLIAGGRAELRDLSLQGPIAMIADEIVSNVRTDGSMESIVATGNVHGTRSTSSGADEIDAGRIQLDLATEDNVPRLLTAGNGVKLTSTSAAFNGGTRRVETDALEIHFAMSSNPGETLIESMNTLAPARVDWRNESIVNGKTVPQSTQLSGNRMNVKFDGQNRLQEAKSAGGVEVTRKLGDAMEQITSSKELSAKFDSQGEWIAIDQSGDVRFRDGQHTGEAERARMERATNALKLDGSVVFADPTTRTTAQSASFLQASNTLRADGNVVTTELRPNSSSLSNFAPVPAHVSGQHLVADAKQQHALYSGNARLWQGQSVIEGDEIELDGPTHTVQAKGHVQGVFPQAPWNPKSVPPSGSEPDLATSLSPKPVSSKTSVPATRATTQLGHVRGGLLKYWEDESRGRIEENARVTSEQGSIQADQIDLFFSESGSGNATKQLTRSVASGDVTVSQEDRRGISGRAEYTASEGKFVLSQGQPTLYSSNGDTTTGRQLTFYFADDRIVVDSAHGSKTVTLHTVEK